MQRLTTRRLIITQSLNNSCIGETIPQFSLPSVMLNIDYLFGQFGLVGPTVSTPNPQSLSTPLLSPSLLLGLRTEGATKKASVLCKHCSAVAKTLVCPQHCHKSKSRHHTSCCEGARSSMPEQAVNTLEGAVLGRRCLFSHRLNLEDNRTKLIKCRSQIKGYL